MQMTADEAISIVREALFCGEHPREAEAEAAIREAFEERDRLRALMAMSTTADEALTALRECAYYDGLGVTSAGLAEDAEAAEAAIREAFAKAEAFDTYVSLNFVDELGEPLDAASAYEILRTSILDDHAIADRARAELARLEAEIALHKKHGILERGYYVAKRNLLKRIIGGEGS